MKTFALLLMISAAVNAVSFIDLVQKDWDLFKIKFNKTYRNIVEENFRLKIYMNNKYKINQHNKLYEQEKVSYRLKMNQFGDLDGWCRYQPTKSGASDKGYVSIPQGNETVLKIAVAFVGPIAASIDANFDFMYYQSGVLYSEFCSKVGLNHAVLVVGYGTTKKGEDYWLVKNSWGKTWGEQGYIRMARNRDNYCGIATDPLFPIV